MNDDKGDFVNALIQAMLMRSVGGAASESTIEERWSDIVASRSGVRIRQLFGAILGGLLAFVGLLFVGLPLKLSGAVSSGWDALLMGCGAALAALVFWGGVEMSLKEYPPRRRLVVTGFGVTLILGGICLAALRLGDPEWWHPLSIVVGLCIVAPAVFFAYNQEADLLDPMGWQSAFERRIGPLLDHWMEQQAPPRVVERPLFPWHHGNRREFLAARPDKENTIDVPAQDDLTLADFLLEAITRGISRAEWLKPGHARFVCPTTNERVTRPTYDKMVRMAERLGYIERGGDGGAAQWLTEPEAAYMDWAERLEEEWQGVLGGEHDARA